MGEGGRQRVEWEEGGGDRQEVEWEEGGRQG